MFANMQQGEGSSYDSAARRSSEKGSAEGNSPLIDPKKSKPPQQASMEKQVHPLVVLPLKYGSIAFAPAPGVMPGTLTSHKELLKLREAETHGDAHFLGWLKETLQKWSNVGGEFSGSLGASSSEIIKTYCMRALLERSRDIQGLKIRVWNNKHGAWQEEVHSSPASLTSRHLIWFDVDMSLCSPDIPDGQRALTLLSEIFHGKDGATHFDAESLVGPLRENSEPSHVPPGEVLSLAEATHTCFAKIPQIRSAAPDDLRLEHFLVYSQPGIMLSVHNGPCFLIERDFGRNALPLGFNDGVEYVQRLADRSCDQAIRQLEFLENYTRNQRQTMSELTANSEIEAAQRKRTVTSIEAATEVISHHMIAIDELQAQLSSMTPATSAPSRGAEAAQWRKGTQEILDIVRKQMKALEQFVARDEAHFKAQKEAKANKYKEEFRNALVVLGSVVGLGSQLPVHIPKYGFWIYAALSLGVGLYQLVRFRKIQKNFA